MFRSKVVFAIAFTIIGLLASTGSDQEIWDPKRSCCWLRLQKLFKGGWK